MRDRKRRGLFVYVRSGAGLAYLQLVFPFIISALLIHPVELVKG